METLLLLMPRLIPNLKFEVVFEVLNIQSRNPIEDIDLISVSLEYAGVVNYVSFLTREEIYELKEKCYLHYFSNIREDGESV